MRQLATVLLAFMLMGVDAREAAAVGDQDAKMYEVLEVLQTITRIPEKGIPPTLLRNAKAIAIIPSVVKVGLVIGGRYGKGVAMVRKANGAWSNPLFISVSGGSIGWQIGAQSTDVVLVFKNRKSINNIISGKFTLGADASVAAGPVGRKASAGTNFTSGSEVYSYSRSRGLFVGITLDGAALKIEHGDNAGYYRTKGIRPAQILSGKGITTPETAKKLFGILKRYR